MFTWNFACIHLCMSATHMYTTYIHIHACLPTYKCVCKHTTCMYACIDTYLFTDIHACVLIHRYSCMSAYMETCMHSLMYILPHTYIYKYRCTHTYMHKHPCMSAYANIFICMQYTCMSSVIHMNIHKYI